MDFDFSDDQQQLRDAVGRWADKAYAFERRRTIVQAGGFDATAWGELAELGLTGLLVPEEHGGMGQGFVDAMVVMEELGRGLVMEPLAQAFMASVLLANHAPSDVAAQWLPSVASGEALIVLAQQERAARYHTGQVAATATPVPGGYAVDAVKHLVPAGDAAQAWIVPAKLEGQVALFLVERGAAGAQTAGYVTQDGSRAANVTLKATPATLVTRHGTQALQQMLDVGTAALCAQAVGIMDRTLAMTVEYMNTRKQFGVAIATFQALRHRVSDMKMQLELARSMSYYATLKLTAADAERSQAISRAKVQLGQSMRFVGQQAVQLHGGIGVTDEYVVSHCFKALTQLEMTFGDTLHQIGQVSDAMTDTAGVFV